LADVKKHGLKKDAMVFVVSNPVDVLTYLALKELPLGPGRIFGLGTMLDTTRLRGILAQQLNVPPTQVSAMMLGEHGDSMVAIWSAAQVAGLPLDKWPGATPSLIQDVEKRTRGSGAEVIKKKTGAGFAVGVSIAEVVHSIALDRRRILPVSTLQTGANQIRDVCLSVPTIIGRGGILGHVEIELWPKERMALQNSAKVLRETIDKVLK
jgi:L-lactate dehydrogenase